MDTWLYADFLEIDQHFIDVYTEEIDRQHSKAWQSYIPQKKTQELLTGIANMLERKQPKPPLFYGPYGTGKTFTAFLIKHLLEDDLDEVIAYFDKYDVLRGLKIRWEAMRKRGNFVVVYRSSASDAGTSLRLAYIVQERISKTLQEKGYQVLNETWRQEMLERLKDPTSTFNWSRAFEKYRNRFKEFSTPEKVIEQLEKSSGEDSLSLMEKLVHIFEKERFAVLSESRLKEWIKEVLRHNKLQGLIFLWDEFTDFFNLPNPPMDLVQELAHLSGEVPFYMGLIVHRGPEIFTRSMTEEDRKKFLDRFQSYHLELAELTAYQLMGGVIRVKPERRDEWERKKNSLWYEVERCCSAILSVDQGRKDDFRHIIPIHPYSAYILANIARTFSSSQRTLFRFLRGGESLNQSNRFSFSSFLQQYPRDGWNWLTVDFLWDYFYAEDDSEYNEEVRRFISHYRARVNNIEHEVERRVYKAVLLLDLLHRRLHDSSTERSLEPTQNRLTSVFEGVLKKEDVNQALNSLLNRHFLGSYSTEQDEVYTLPVYIRDDEKFDEIKENLKSKYRFKELVGQHGDFRELLAKELELSPPIGMRQKLCILAAEEFLSKRERVLPENELKPYQVGVVIILPFDRNQAGSATELALKLSEITNRIIYAVANEEFGEERWDKWLDQKALEKYAEDHGEKGSMQSCQERANRLVKEWIQKVINGGFRAFFLYGKAITVVGKDGYQELLEEVVDAIYPDRPETLFPTATLYSGNWGKHGAEVGLGLASKLTSPYADVVDTLMIQKLWDTKNWPESHPLTKMRMKLKGMFDEQGEINLAKAWNLLMGPPYGLMPSRIGIMLFAFLLKEYTEGHYYWDGYRCESLNANTLADLVTKVVKVTRDAENYAIRKMLPVEENICELLRKFFDLPEDGTRYLRTALIKLREFLLRIGYPLWALEYTSGIPSDSLFEEDVNRLQQFMVSNPDSNNWNQEQLEELEKSLNRLNDYFAGGVAKRKNSYEEGMKLFLERKAPDLQNMCKELDLNIDKIMNKLRNLMQEEVYLWEKEKVCQRFSLLTKEYQLTLNLNKLMGTDFEDLEEALNHLRKNWLPNNGKLPIWLIAEAAEGELKEAFELLSELFYAEKISHEASDLFSRWAQRSSLLASKREEIRKALKDHSVFIRWLQQSYLASEFPFEEGDELFSVLSEEHQFYNINKVELEDFLRKHLKDSNLRRLIGELRQLWSEVTGSITPSQWCQERGIPIHFLLTKPDFQNVFDTVERPGDKNENQIRTALDILRMNKEDFFQLRDMNWVQETFKSRVLNDYTVIVSNDRVMKYLKNFLNQRLGSDLLRWDLSKAQEEAKKWVRDLYRQKVYRQVLDKLKECSFEELWKIIEKIAEDPRVGIQLLITLKRLS